MATQASAKADSSGNSGNSGNSVDVFRSLSAQAANENQDVSASYRITNRGGVTLEVPLVHVVTKEKTSVFLQPGGQPRIPRGYRIDPVFAARNPVIGATLVA